MAGVPHNAGCSAGEAGAVDEWDTDDPSSSLHSALQGLAVGCNAAPIPHSDAAGQDAGNRPDMQSQSPRHTKTEDTRPSPTFSIALLSLWAEFSSMRNGMFFLGKGKELMSKHTPQSPQCIKKN